MPQPHALPFPAHHIPIHLNQPRLTNYRTQARELSWLLDSLQETLASLKSAIIQKSSFK
ncbi:hypothetical protein DL95DRAFT_391123 [Leptodontidium sp. 2 PMI_412]|nr:hypothetical protein DL95DRAFT_391123 [Leptodontidium sp. 2 PMI_412]